MTNLPPVFDPDHAMPIAPHDAEWDELTARLEDRLDVLVDSFHARLEASGIYAPGLVHPDDLARSAWDTLRMLVLRLASRPVPARLAAAPSELGVRRARQGVPLESLLDAARLDFRVLWAALTDLAGPGSDALLVRHVELVLSTVERYVSEVQQAFLAEEAILRRDSRLATARHISRLFANKGLDTELAEEIAERLGVPLRGTFDVVVVVGDGATLLQDWAARHRTNSSWMVHELAGAVCFFQPTEGPLDVERFAGLAGGYREGVKGLPSVPRAAEGALILARHSARSAHPRLVSVSDGWLPVAHELLAEALPGFDARVHQALERRTPHERERMLEAVERFAETGSIKETSELLFCHRNTVVNRLRTFQEITGLDVTIPLQAALALVSLQGGGTPR